MSRKLLQALLLALLVAGVVGTGVAQKGGKSVVIPMTALFSGESGVKITDDGLGPYVHQGTTTELNNVQIEGDGHFIMVVRTVSHRMLNLLFDTQCRPPVDPNPVDCADPNFLLSPTPVQTTYWMLRTYWKCRYIPHVENDGTIWTELVRSTTRKDSTILNLKTMVPGETVGVSVEGMRFNPTDNESTTGYDESTLDNYLMTGTQLLESSPGSAAYLLVTATDWDGDGVMDWILRTIPGKVVIKEWDRTDVLPDGDCFRLTCGFPCEYGSYKLPFELKIARK
jgi:hypothetical protein